MQVRDYMDVRVDKKYLDRHVEASRLFFFNQSISHLTNSFSVSSDHTKKTSSSLSFYLNDVTHSYTHLIRLSMSIA